MRKVNKLKSYILFSHFLFKEQEVLSSSQNISEKVKGQEKETYIRGCMLLLIYVLILVATGD